MILIAGATGALGGMITRELLVRGETVRVLVRPGSSYGELVEAGAQPVMGDLRDPESLRRACADVRTVITTANSATRSGGDTVDAVDRAGNRNLIDAAAAAGVAHFIFISALGASLESPVPFLQAKAEAEQHLRSSGMEWTILQPNIFMDTWIPTLVGIPLSQNRPVSLVRPATHRHALIASRDVAAFGVEAVRNPAARNAVLVLGGPGAVTWSDVVRLTGEVLGRDLPVELIAPGAPLPGLPDVVAQLAASFETYETVLDTGPVADRFGVRLTPVESYLREQFAPQLEA